MSVNGTTPAPQEPFDYNELYGYTPTLYICALFVALYALSTIIHAGEALYYRIWWLFPTAVTAGIAEIIGWSGRLWSSKKAGLNPFLMQITTTGIAPTFLVAANFVILGRIVISLGRQYSRISPMWYTVIFCSFDVVALTVQAVGGASASQAAANDTDADKGGRIMLAGIAFQLATITVYVAFATEFFVRYALDKPVRLVPAPDLQAKTEESSVGSQKTERGVLTSRLKLMIIGLTFSTVLIFIRSIYRTIELSDGWSGRIITTQVYYNVLDGAMITLAMFTLNFLHPGYLLK